MNNYSSCKLSLGSAPAQTPLSSARQRWKELPVEETKTGLFIGGMPVVERWEEPAQRKLAEVAARRGGPILEIGYGLGLATRAIQDAQPQQHIVVESHPQVAHRASNKLSGRTGVSVISAFWEELVDQLEPGFNGILYDVYPIDGNGFSGSIEEVKALVAPFLPHAARLLKSAGVFCFLDFQDTDDTLWQTLAEAHGLQYENRHPVGVEPSPDCSYDSISKVYVVEMSR